MPNYFIQAQTGHFNPMSFDDMVKPLNMYKQYYEQNEEKLTELQAQAKLWEDIANSELDAEYADKYNNYAQSLENAAQQLSNGMSYNLRKQVQDLRAQSAIVNQIENAYALRAKDIDAYNKMMYEDPSRIGATNPRNIRLNEYFGGPIQMNYGVSGDRLNKLGAMQSYNMADTSAIETELSIVDQLQTNGQDINSIMNFLEDNNSMVYKMAENIMAGDNMPFQKGTTEYNQALLQTINGIASGVQQRRAELAKAKASKKGESSDDWNLSETLANSQSTNINMPNYVPFDKETAMGQLLQETIDGDPIKYFSSQEDPNKLSSTKLLQLEEEKRQLEEDDLTTGPFDSLNYRRVIKKIDREKERLEEIDNQMQLNGIPGATAEERYHNYINFYMNANKMDNTGWMATGNTELIGKLNNLYKEKYQNNVSDLRYYEDGKWESIDDQAKINKIIKEGSIRYTTNGISVLHSGKDGNRTYMISSGDNKTNEYNRDMEALNANLLTIDGQNNLYQNCVEQGAYYGTGLPVQIGNSDYYCYLSSDGNRFVFIRNDGNSMEEVGTIQRFNANAAMSFLQNLAVAASKNDLINIK